MRFVSLICRAGLTVVGGLMVLTAMSGTALAFDGVTPEIDPTSIASAVTLFMGSVMLLTAKRRK
jgi:hypothetical protein